jgi:DNA polymerase III alpha subunit (gram-positive type)
MDSIDGVGNTSQLSDSALPVNTSGISADMSAGKQSPGAVTKGAISRPADACIKITQTCAELIQLLQAAGNIMDPSREMVCNVMTAEYVSANIQKYLTTAQDLFCKIAGACQEIRQQLRSVSGKRKALKAANSTSADINTWVQELLRVLKQACDASGFNEQLLEAFQAAEESLQSALQALNDWTQTSSHCQVKDNGENDATTTSADTSTMSSRKFPSSHMTSCGHHSTP